MAKNNDVSVGQRWVVRQQQKLVTVLVTAQVEREGRTLWCLRNESSGRDLKPHAATFLRRRIDENPCAGHARGDIANCHQTLCGWFGR